MDTKTKTDLDNRSVTCLSGDSQEMDLAKVQDIITAVVWKVAGPYLSEQDVEDIVQDVNVRLLGKHRKQYDSARGMKPSTWAYLVAQCCALDALRAARRRPQMVSLDPAMKEADLRDAFSRLLEAERFEIYRCAVDELGPENAAFIRETMADDFDAREYSARHGMSFKTVYCKKHRLVSKLTKIVSGRVRCAG